ncbi:hypothetical protein R1sor_002956 [Riccia sorocarpa]|uniref:alpha-1,2-Mannosidase n=1 Tax=Riccia sorocarpa TaxID=122646 RepID=A0ABD3H6D0_9MARC
MGSDLPSFIRPDSAETPYDNAKVRRRSSLKVSLQTWLSSSVSKSCTSCSFGKFLAIILLIGLGYVVVTYTPPPGSLLQRSGEHGGDKQQRSSGQTWRKTMRSKDVKSVPQNDTKVVTGDLLQAEELIWRQRQGEVVAAFRHAWKGYKDFAMGYDELQPLSKRGNDGLGGLGATIVDALDTAIIMGCEDVVQDAALWIESELPGRLQDRGQVNLFETTIRVLGGLLSAFSLLGGEKESALKFGVNPKVFLERAIDLGDRLHSAFSMSPSAVPFSDVNLREKRAHAAGFDGGASSTAEVTTLQMEFWYLSHISGDPKYGKSAMRVYEHVKGLPKTEGLVPVFISPNSGDFVGNNIRLGSRGDSYYEYLLKVWLQQGGADSDASAVTYLRDMYEEAISGVRHLLVKKSQPNGLVFVGELPNGITGNFSPKMDHLVCFLAGTLALGATRGMTKDQALRRGFMSERDLHDLKLAEDLCHTCYQMYAVTATGLAPEIVYFNMDERSQTGQDGGRKDAKYAHDIQIHPLDRHNLLRPETVESLFVLYRVTGDIKYREWGWKIFQAFEAHTKVSTGGYSSLETVTTVPARRRDKMETFFLGETLKYLYLLFSDRSVLPLDKYVFNTEAHPLPIIVPTSANGRRNKQTLRSRLKDTGR